MALLSAPSIRRRCLLLLAVQQCAAGWTDWVTDGSSAAECPPASAVAGFQCEGRYCDNMKVYCRSTGAKRLRTTYTSSFSEESVNYRICPDGGFVSGLQATGKYSDNLKLRCSVMAELSPKKCVWTDSMSEETPFAYKAPASWYVAGMKCEGRYCDDVSLYLCNAKIAEVTPAAYAELYAPLLRFDSEFGTGSGDSLKCFPSDPQKYVDGRKEGITAQGLCNQDYDIISKHEVPIFYIPRNGSDGNSIVIRYWYFYAYQSTCLFDQGSHAADWESIAVVLEDGVPVRTIYYQHGGYYSKLRGKYDAVGTHPVVYVGKNAHGSYHDAGGHGGCCYFADYRKPGTPDYHMDTWNNLTLLTRNGTSDWMDCEGKCFDGIAHPIDQMHSEFAGCHDIELSAAAEAACRFNYHDVNGCEYSDVPSTTVLNTVEF